MTDESTYTAEREPEIEITMVDLLVDAVVGVGFPTLAIAIVAEREGMATFNGNQHNESWRWNRDKLCRVSEEKLQALYHNLKVAQHGS